jgi:hypothetical protein
MGLLHWLPRSDKNATRAAVFRAGESGLRIRWTTKCALKSRFRKISEHPALKARHPAIVALSFVAGVVSGSRS